MNKKIVCMAMCAVMAFSAAALTGCGDSDSSSAGTTASSASAKTKDVSAIAEKLASDITYKDKLMEFTDDKIESVAGVSKDLFKVGKVYRGSGATAEEIDCFEAADEKSAGLIYDILKKYLDNQKARYVDYAPAEMDKLEKAVLVQDGVYVFLSISDDDAAAKTIIGC